MRDIFLYHIKGFEDYCISRTGKVLSPKGRYLTPRTVKDGYLGVTLSKNNIQKQFLIHRLVAKYFIPNPKNKSEVNHKDGNKQNNNDWNLEWNTRSENEKHAWETGLKTRSNNRAIEQYSKNGEYIYEWSSITKASKDLDIHVSNIHRALSGDRKTAGKFIWKYKNYL